MATIIPQATPTERARINFGKIPPAMELPNLISVQKQSFERFCGEGLREAFRESSPIRSQNHVLEVTFGEHQFGDPAHSVEECREKDMTYQAPLLTEVRLTNRETGEIKEQLVFMGDFPMMTEQGTFIINGTERIVVSQLVRSPGVYYSKEMDGGKQVYKAQIIPARGAWLEFEVDKRDQLVVSIDRKRKQSATTFLRALGIAVTNDEIIELLGDSDVVKRTIERDTALTREDALIEIYRRLRPGEPPTVDASRSLIEGLLFNQPALRPGARGPLQGQQEARPHHRRRRADPDRRGHRRHPALPARARRRRARFQGRRHRPLRQPPRPHRGRAGGQPVPHRHEPHGARRARAHELPGRRRDHPAVAHQHPPDRGGHQGVLRLLAAQRSSWTSPTR